MAHKQRSIETDIFGIPVNTLSINSKNKGNSNERACAKYLSEWVGVKFVRVPMSGGLRRDDTDKTVGDIIIDTTDKNFDFKFVVETKHLKKIPVSRVLRKSSIVFTIWEQVHSDAMRGCKLPMAVVRENNMPKGEYYVILASEYGGTLMACNVPVLFSGCNEAYNLVGFRLSDIKRYMPYNKFDSALHRFKLLHKFIGINGSKFFRDISDNK